MKILQSTENDRKSLCKLQLSPLQKCSHLACQTSFDILRCQRFCNLSSKQVSTLGRKSIHENIPMGQNNART